MRVDLFAAERWMRAAARARDVRDVRRVQAERGAPGVVLEALDQGAEALDQVAETWRKVTRGGGR